MNIMYEPFLSFVLFMQGYLEVVIGPLIILGKELFNVHPRTSQNWGIIHHLYGDNGDTMGI